MFGKKMKNEKPVVVTTKEELKAAIKNKKPYIEVQGSLAKKMKWMTKLNHTAVLALLPALGLISVTGAVPAASVAALAVPAAGIAGGEVTIAIVAISASVIIAIMKGYDIEADAKGSIRLINNKK